MKSKQSDKNLTKQIRIDAGLHKILKVESSKAGASIKTLLEGFIAEGLKEITTGKST